MAAVNTNVRGARTQTGLSQEALAQQVGVSRQAYAAVEAGRAVPSTEVALRLARALRTTVEALFSLADEPGKEIGVELAGGAAAVPADTRVQLAQVGNRLLARPLVGGPAAVHTLARAEGLVVRRSGAGRRVRVRLLDQASLRQPCLVIAGCDPAVVFLTAPLQERGMRAVWSEEGSRDALRALARGEAHVAGCHLLDEASGRYNLPWVKRLVPFPCTVVSFAQWRQGLIVAARNPRGIQGVEDLAGPGVHFINRQPGSGSRVLVDRLLRRSGIRPGMVAGYERHVNGHLAVAEVVAAGLADAGVGVEAAARAFGLAFLPLGEEQYDLVIPDRLLDEPAVQLLLDALRRPQVRRQVEALGGYDAAAMGQPARV